ncbi:MAG: DUF968 domain-containing protein [Acidobacteria bacterium]|nr:DUF968 domain-containing protein [Acidobacteriota bacterium]
MATEKAQASRPPQSPQPGVALQTGALPLAPKGGKESLCMRLSQRNSMYLDYVQSRPCSFCLGRPCEPHHAFKRLGGISTGGLGRKGSDYLSIAVCRQCHERIHIGSLRPSHADLRELIVIHLVCFIDENAARLSVSVSCDYLSDD